MWFYYSLFIFYCFPQKQKVNKEINILTIVYINYGENGANGD